ncbi:tail fiber domain-containing protein [Microbulbifer sp. SSSA005]|uniref:tail fiber domain-containing protein n=1 Tax=Microbulbifer sp. SSSA005 TaxID=3243378 RepID=UPI00403A522C
MGFLDSLMGGGGESKSQSYLDEDQKGYLNDIWGEGQRLYNSGQSPVADLTPEMQQYIQAAMGFGNTANGYASQVTGASNDFGNTADTMQNYLNQVMGSGGYQTPMQNGVDMNTVNSLIDNDLINSQITASTRDIYRDLNENQLPGIASGAVSTGNTGSTRRGVAEAIAARGADDRASDVAAGIRSNAYDQAVQVAANQSSANQGAQLTTNNLNSSLATNNFGTAGNLFNTGFGSAYNMGMGGVSMMGQGGNAMQNYMQQVAMAPWQKLQLYQGSVGNPIVLNESMQTQSGSPLGALGGFMEGAGALAQGGGFAAMFSDARLKADLREIGETSGGHKLYSWAWNASAAPLGLHGRGVGVIAQEVVKSKPDAVSEDVSGYLKVDYEKLN